MVPRASHADDTAGDLVTVGEPERKRRDHQCSPDRQVLSLPDDGEVSGNDSQEIDGLIGFYEID